MLRLARSFYCTVSLVVGRSMGSAFVRRLRTCLRETAPVIEACHTTSVVARVRYPRRRSAGLVDDTTSACKAGGGRRRCHGRRCSAAPQQKRGRPLLGRGSEKTTGSLAWCRKRKKKQKTIAAVLRFILMPQPPARAAEKIRRRRGVFFFAGTLDLGDFFFF